MKGLIISCKKASLLIEKTNGAKLSYIEAFQLRVHTTMCSACRLYEKQSVLITNFLKEKKKNDFSDDEVEDIQAEIIKRTKTN